MPFYRLLYRSKITLNMSHDELNRQIDDIVASSCTANADVGLTGALIAFEGMFIQVLEGSLAPLERTFERICCDLRHRHVQLVDLAAAEQRLFADWNMVRVDHDGGLARLYDMLGKSELPHLDVAKASSLISLMLSVLPPSRAH
ncbi:BLUF domain-containing protein [Xaviernesmea oryzae]|uniref:BLUF domain-containing protein n=1 Tax=Xaviernesmea oryzae TaxID=464029 RepID=UPI0008D380CD|nr:BLUF domain-containing protein [Xaviernesmea oryzae]SEM11106.1 Sensors of blue-light using FAD [Xaviernesmea oryzae]